MSVGDAHVSSGSARARGRAETRRRLVAAATQLFAAQGLHRVTSAQIARRAGVATGTFYLHFRDKESLFREIVFDALGQLRARQDRASDAVARQAPGEPGSGLRRELEARNRELLRFAEENRDLIRLLFGRGAGGSAIGEEILDAIVPDVERRLREAVAAGRSPADLHAGAAAQALTALILRLIVWWIENPELVTREQVIETILRMHPGLAEDAAPPREPADD